jgi:hypothetical protein
MNNCKLADIADHHEISVCHPGVILENLCVPDVTPQPLPGRGAINWLNLLD